MSFSSASIPRWSSSAWKAAVDYLPGMDQHNVKGSNNSFLSRTSAQKWSIMTTLRIKTYHYCSIDRIIVVVSDWEKKLLSLQQLCYLFFFNIYIVHNEQWKRSMIIMHFPEDNFRSNGFLCVINLLINSKIFIFLIHILCAQNYEFYLLLK